MDDADKGRLTTKVGLSGRMFLLVPAHPDCCGQNPQSHKMVVCGICSEYYAHTHTIVLLLFWNLSGTTRVSKHQKGKKQEGKPIWIYWSKR